MDSISPLAKILAEANGIDWRSIQGSGQGGSVVEQDILNYLSRVMSGDEEPPATPVDEIPEGWTGEMPPMPVNPSGLEALKAAGVESDITDFVDRQAQAAMPQVAAQAVAAQPVLAQPVAAVPVTEMPVADMPVAVIPVAQYPVAEPVVIRPVTPEVVPTQAAVMAAPVAEPHAAPVVAPAAAYDDLDSDAEFELDDLNEDDLELDDPELGSAPDWSLGTQAQPDVQVPAVQVEHAYDPVEADPEADFVLADSHPAESYTAESYTAEGYAAESYTVDSDTADSYAATSSVTEAAAPSTPSDPYGLGAPVVAPMQDASPVAVHADFSQPPVEAPANVAFAAPIPPIPEVSVPEQDIPLLKAMPEQVEPEQREIEPVQLHEVPVAEPAQNAPVEAVAAVATGAAGFGLGGFLSRLYGNKNAAPSEPVASDPLSSEPAFSEPVPSEAVRAEPLATEDAEPLVAPAADVHEAAAPDLHTAETPEPVLGEPLVSQAPPIPDTPVAAPLVADQWRDQEPAVSEYAEPEQPIALPEAHEAEQQPEPVMTEQVQAQDAEVVAAVSEPATASELVPASATTGAGVTTLRLNVDLSALETARAQLSEALYRDVPLPLLVARAAARSAGTLGLNGPVALGTHAGQALAADLSGDFRASLDDLKRHADAQPALLVLDAAELGLDELHRGACSLSLGRTSLGGTGAGQAALSLRGDVDPVRGAQFLHEVSGLLGTPIRLLF